MIYTLMPVIFILGIAGIVNTPERLVGYKIIL